MQTFGAKIAGERVEIKKIDKPKNVQHAVDYEFRRHVELLSEGKRPENESRYWDPKQGKSVFIRHMETEPDYRYFQDPDLPCITVTNKRISHVHKILGEIPFDAKRRFCDTFGMDVSDVKVIFKNKWSIELFTRLVWTLQVDPKTAFRW